MFTTDALAMPQPLSSVIPSKNYGVVEFSPSSMHHRAELAAMIMEMVSIWSSIDLEVSRLMTKFLKADFEVVSEMLLALTSAEARKAAVRAAAKASLNNDDLSLFDAVHKVIRPSRDRRNHFVHHIWGTTDALPRDLLLIDPRYLARQHANIEGRYRDLLASMQVTQESDVSFYLIPQKIMVYSPEDINRDLREAMMAMVNMLHLRVTLEGGPNAVDSRRQLVEQSDIASCLKV